MVDGGHAFGRKALFCDADHFALFMPAVVYELLHHVLLGGLPWLPLKGPAPDLRNGLRHSGTETGLPIAGMKVLITVNDRPH